MPGKEVRTVPVLLVRTGKNEVTALSTTPPGNGWLPLAAGIAGKVQPHLSGLAGNSGGHVTGRAFEMKAQDLAYWDSFRPLDSGEGYFYGTVVDSRSKFAKNVSFKEVSPSAGGELAPPPLDPVAIATAVAVQQIQAQIERLTELLEEVDAKVDSIISFLQLEQQAELLASVFHEGAGVSCGWG